MTLSINGKTYDADELIAYHKRLEKENAELKKEVEKHKWNNIFLEDCADYDKKIAEEYTTLQERIERLKKENAEFRTVKFPQLERKIASIREAHSVDCKKLNARIKQVERLKNENIELRKENNKLTRKCNCLTKCNDGLQDLLDNDIDVLEKLVQLQKENAELKERKAELKGMYAHSAREAGTYKQFLELKEKENAELKAKVTALENANKSMVKELNDMSSGGISFLKNVIRSKEEIDKAKEVIENLLPFEFVIDPYALKNDIEENKRIFHEPFRKAEQFLKEVLE